MNIIIHFEFIIIDFNIVNDNNNNIIIIVIISTPNEDYDVLGLVAIAVGEVLWVVTVNNNN